MKNAYPLFIFYFLFFSFSSFSQQSIQLTSNADRLSIMIDQDNQQIQLCGLQPGHHYEASIQANGVNCKINFQNQNNSTIQFTAQSTCENFTLLKQCTGKIPAYFSVADLYPTSNPIDHPEALLEVTHGFSADELIQGVLIGNDCATDLNVELHGEDIQFGSFSEGAASVGFDNGIIISTGNIDNAIGPNNSGSQGTNVPNNNTDTDLAALVTQSTYDAAVLEFDFTPVSNSVQFEYVFASEEYCEFVNDDYNDVFGFFVSGPGIVGKKNIALVPSTGEYVSIDNINHLKNSNLFFPNSSTCGGITNSDDIQFDGYTTPLVATIDVIPCETYHIKLAVADVGDGIYDSAVFLKAGSFNAGDIVQVTPKSNIVQAQNSIEGCENGYLVFDRSCSNDINQPLTLYIDVLPSSTATQGVDYVTLPTSITLPAGVLSDSIPIFAIADGINEGDETINVEITGQYPCYKPTATIILSEKEPILLTGLDTIVCEHTPITLQPGVQGGYGPFSYLWDDGTIDSIFTENITSTTTFSCEVTDICNNQSQIAFNINMAETPNGLLLGDNTLCDPTSTATIDLQFNGTAPWDVTIEKDNNTHFTKQYTTPTSSFDVNQPGVYKISSIASNGCMGSASGQAEIEHTTLAASVSKIDIACYGDSTGSLTITATGGNTPYQYIWNTTSQDTTAAISQLPIGLYSIILTDQDGCKFIETILLSQPDELIYTIDTVQHVNCFSPQGGYVTTQTSGGTQPFDYQWSNGQMDPNATVLPDGIISGTITDSQGCTDSVETIIIGDFEVPIININPPDTINCYHPEITLSALGTSIGSDFTYQWTTNNGQIVQGGTTLNPSVNLAGLYDLITSNIKNGCTSTQSQQVAIDTLSPLVDAGPTFALNCTDTTTTIGTPSTTQNWEYFWTTSSGHIINSFTTPITTVDAAGQYELLVTNLTNGCTNTDDVQITEITSRPEEATVYSTDPTCLEYDGSIAITDVRGGTPPFLYSYDGGQTFLDTSSNHTLNHGAFEIIIQDIYGCEYKTNAFLNAPIQPTLNVVPEYIIELGDSVRLETYSSVFADELMAILWSPNPDTACMNCLTPYAKPYSTTEYDIKIIDSLHCEASAKILVMVQDADVYIPNIFSPEGNIQGNWAFTVFGNMARIQSIINLKVFDRWGNQVFNQDKFAPNNMALGWDGQSRDKKSPAGVYIYSAEVEFINGDRKRYSGDVTLVR